MLIALDLVAVVSALVQTRGAFDDVSRPDSCLTVRQIGKENLLGLAVLAREAKIPLSGGKNTHPVNLSSEN